MFAIGNVSRLLLGAGFIALLAGCASGPQLEPLTARVVSDEPLTLPPDAVLEVQLEDRTQGAVLASGRFERLSQLPIPVTLQYVPDAIVNDNLYHLSAQIRSQGRILYFSQEPATVFGLNDPVTPDIPVVSTGAGANR